MTASSITRSFVERTRELYERTQYVSYAYALSHPDHLAVIGRLFGLTPPDPASARILEIGCASGGNLIPVAMNYPQSRCLGIDLSDSHIEAGREDIAAFGLTNVSLEARDLLEFDPDGCEFDYIIAHGVYSWVPPEVRERILEISQQNLSTNGIAYISYNCYPGWHINEIPRYLMYRNCDHISDPDTRYHTALDLLTEFAAVARDTDAYPLARIYRECQASLKNLGPDYVLHDHLEPVNTPFYFRDFVYACAHKDLGYVCDAELTPMLLSAQPQPVQDLIGRIANNRLETEEYLDFIAARTFRSSLLTHSTHELDLEIKPQRLLQMQAASRLEVKDTEGDGYCFGLPGSNDDDIHTSSDIIRHAISLMHAAWPCSLAIDSLFLNSAGAAGYDLEALDDTRITTEIESFTRDLLMLKIMGHLELSMTAPVCCNRISDHPCLSPWVLHQAKQGNDKLTSQKHQNIPCPPGRHNFLMHLDGRHDSRQLQTILAEDIRQGVIPVEGGIRPATLARKPELVAGIYTALLEELLDHALLIA